MLKRHFFENCLMCSAVCIYWIKAITEGIIDCIIPINTVIPTIRWPTNILGPVRMLVTVFNTCIPGSSNQDWLIFTGSKTLESWFITTKILLSYGELIQLKQYKMNILQCKQI